ncbi:MAG TPA: YqaA family protein [Rudaea sp.]|nr:YqaA family protein [Rudaea sp.]
MKLFKPLYEFALRWAAHRRAEWYLAGLSFIEAFIFPIAPEIMLAPMTLARPRLWARFATISLSASLLGAFVGYALGHYAFQYMRPLLVDLGWMPKFESLVAQLHTDDGWHVFWLLVLAGFLPIPLKVFTWAAGFVGVPLPAFVAGMLVGRGKRVYLLCGLIRLGGPRAEQALHRWIEWIGWGVLVLMALVVVYFRYLR